MSHANVHVWVSGLRRSLNQHLSELKLDRQGSILLGAEFTCTLIVKLFGQTR